ncbi:MAG: sulfotransferase [Syntrophobacteraceae bacterium]|nr:sulfotransferase [Syntrophobacteraceae bacterium]
MGRYFSKTPRGIVSGKTSARSPYWFGRKGLPGLINSLCRILSVNGPSVIGLDRKALLEKAARLTGLDDTGDRSFFEPLAVLLQSIESDARLNLVGRLCFRGDILRMLCNRLYLQEDRRRYPHIADQVISAPLFITGLPRTGSTLLHALLASDPASRAPQVWEVMYPSPPPQRTSYNRDPRIDKTAGDLKWLGIIMPGFKRVHMIGPGLPQECIAITAHSFISYLFESMYFVDSYRAWHERQDKHAAYVYHRQFLQHLQAFAPGTHWVLKAPSHLFALKALLGVYPDARIVLTHRDPLEALPSCASFTEVLRGAFTDAIDREKLGREIARHWQKGASLAVEFSQTNRMTREPPLNILYTDLIRDPMGVVRLIYRHFEMKFTNEAEEAMLRFLAKNPQNSNGVHHYSLGEFGLDQDRERRRFAFYTDFFGIEPVS